MKLYKYFKLRLMLNSKIKFKKIKWVTIYYIDMKNIMDFDMIKNE